MNVYFSKLDNGDWICYDQHNTTGDLFVDPEKISLLYDVIRETENCSSWQSDNIGWNVTIFQYVEHELVGFGTIMHNVYVYVKGGVIQRCSIRAGHEGEEIADFDKTFILKLDRLPDFEPYPYPEANNV